MKISKCFISIPWLIYLIGASFIFSGSFPLQGKTLARAPELSNQPASTNTDISEDNSQLQMQTGTEVILNGRVISLPWVQWQEGDSLHTGISDTGAETMLGIELLSTNQYQIQPIHWFPYYQKVPTKFINPYRYLDLTEFAKIAKISLEVEGSRLKIDLPPTQVKKAYAAPELNGQKIIVELERPTFWQFSQGKDQGIIKIEAQATPELIELFQPQQPTPPTIEEDEGDKAKGSENETKNQPLFTIENSNNQAIITVNIPAGKNLRVSSGNPNLLFIDIQPAVMLEREITWSPNIFWQQKYLLISQDDSVQKKDLFFVSYLTVDLKDFNLDLRPITTNSNNMAGTAPLLKIAQNYAAIAAINGGFFNRNNQLPLGAIRKKGKWLSGPILNRGAFAWNEIGQVKIGRLRLQETLTTLRGERLVINYLNSGYIQPGISRYTTAWGSTYTTLTDKEIIVLIEEDKVKGQIHCEKAGEDSLTIPEKGYLLTIRKAENLASKLETDMQVKLDSFTVPGEFANYPNIIGAGPVLILNRQIVLDGETEKFSGAFNAQKASRSAIATTSDGKLLLVAVHKRVGGAGPTLLELVQILQNLGAVDALNLDGGSSTQLYLGGQIIDRSPATAARVHNGIGIFLLSD
jgi:hypothetical protein